MTQVSTSVYVSHDSSRTGVAFTLSLEKTSQPPLASSSTRTLVLPVMPRRHGAMVATVGFLRGEPQDCNQSLCQKRAPWAPLQLIQPNNKQQITVLACRQEQSPHGRARKRRAYSSRLPTQGRHLGSRAASGFSFGQLKILYVGVFFFSEPSLQLIANAHWANRECVGSVKIKYSNCLLLFFKDFCLMIASRNMLWK